MHDLQHYPFSAGLTADTLRGFLVHCYRHGVSDIHLQSGGPIVVDHHGRKIVASAFPLEHPVLLRLMDEIYSPDIRARVQAGQGADRALQLEGDSNGRYGLARGERVRFRTNFIQATIGMLTTAMAVTLRVIPSAIPDLDDLGLEDELYHALLP